MLIGWFSNSFWLNSPWQKGWNARNIYDLAEEVATNEQSNRLGLRHRSRSHPTSILSSAGLASTNNPLARHELIPLNTRKTMQIETKTLQPLLLRVDEAAHLMSLSRSTIYEMMAKQELPSVRYGNARRIPFAAIQQWIKDNTIGAYHG